MLLNAFLSSDLKFDPIEYLVEEFPDEKSRKAFEESQTINISDEFTQQWGIRNAYHVADMEPLNKFRRLVAKEK